jgi:hypothetical protein
VFIPRILDIMLIEPFEYIITSFHTTKVVKFSE